MSSLVPADQIETIVGTHRRAHDHYGRAASESSIFYILHSYECKGSGIDLRECPFSLALDAGIRFRDWDGYEDEPALLGIYKGRLVPDMKAMERQS